MPNAVEKSVKRGLVLTPLDLTPLVFGDTDEGYLSGETESEMEWGKE